MNEISRHSATRLGEDLFRLSEPVSQIYERDGIEGLRSVSGLSGRIELAIRSLIVTGKLPMPDRLRGEMDPVELLRSVPGIGRVQAERLHHDFGIDTLEDLEAAAHGGRLGRIEGFGARRIAEIKHSLASQLGRARPVSRDTAADVPVGELLDIDREYRESAAAGLLRKVTPRRFNPNGEAWLPILHTERGERRYTALYSNTATAHKTDSVGDRVLIYWNSGEGRERQSTVLTAHQGPANGQRVVSRRETECAAYYQGRLAHAA